MFFEIKYILSNADATNHVPWVLWLQNYAIKVFLVIKRRKIGG